MALSQLALLPMNSIAIHHPLKKKFLFLANKSSNVPRSIQCKSSSANVSTENQTNQSPSKNYNHSIWQYDHIQSLRNEYKNESYLTQISVLKTEVREMLSKATNNMDQIELINVLQRLGVAYHFKDEIRNILDNNYKIKTFMRKKDLYATSLEFRIFRQHGYHISTDVFHPFLDERDNFNDVEFLNVEGILSLYEASFHSLEHETILDDIRDNFGSKFLKEYVKKNNNNNYISLLINHALEYPLHWRLPRWEHYWFMQVYEKRHNFCPTLLRFAKLDYNILQSIYQEELKDASRWWKGTDLAEKLSLFRDMLVENYGWGLGMNYLPDLKYFRTNIAKVNSFVTVFDDIYDVYGTLEELEVFTQAIQRWDLNAMECLPHYMKMSFLALNNFINDVAYETLKDNGNNILPYLRKSWIDVFQSYLKEARWYHNRCKPSFKEYMDNAWITIGGTVVFVHAYFMVPNSYTKQELLSNLEEYPNMVRYSSTIFRLTNDLGTTKCKSENGDLPKAVECYMNETGASESDARDHIKSMIVSTWKKMNKELHNNSTFPQSLLDIVENIPKTGLFFYQYDDGHAIQDPIISGRLSSFVMQPIPTED